MKRKKMVEEMARFINNKIQFRDDYISALNFGSRLLSIIEENGMKPPCDNSCHPDNYKKGVVFQQCNFQWESEDE